MAEAALGGVRIATMKGGFNQGKESIAMRCLCCLATLFLLIASAAGCCGIASPKNAGEGEKMQGGRPTKGEEEEGGGGGGGGEEEEEEGEEEEGEEEEEGVCFPTAGFGGSGNWRQFGGRYTMRNNTTGIPAALGSGN